ncbi:hypothetical protein GX51_08054 [Blastomyces parvus]|uniref:Uncharacterized protein n=1 Tax=Blastomyces parvus TaxID=2060905 RepID=A0A2B7WHG1_9EURO|nr:hypothetical protein GX51_08054 [Blastomyces parvus]
MQQKLVGASISLLIVSVLLSHFHILSALSRVCRRDVFYMKNAAALNYLANSFEETCPSGSMQFEHHSAGDELWETKVPASQRPRILNPASKRLFRSITVSGMRRGYNHRSQHKEQKRKQHPLPSSLILRSQTPTKGSHTVPPQYNHDANNKDNEKRNKNPPRLYRETSLQLPLEIKLTPQPRYTPYQQHGQKQQQPQPHFHKLSRSKSDDDHNNTSSPIHPTSPSAVSSHPPPLKDTLLPNLLLLIARVAQQGPQQWHCDCNRTNHHLSSTADKLLDSQTSSSHLSSSSSSSPLRPAGGRFLSRDNEIRGSFLGMVVCVVVSVMWI